jgi:hypothetical protein
LVRYHSPRRTEINNGDLRGLERVGKVVEDRMSGGGDEVWVGSVPQNFQNKFLSTTTAANLPVYGQKFTTVSAKL